MGGADEAVTWGALSLRVLGGRVSAPVGVGALADVSLREPCEVSTASGTVLGGPLFLRVAGGASPEPGATDCCGEILRETDGVSPRPKAAPRWGCSFLRDAGMASPPELEVEECCDSSFLRVADSVSLELTATAFLPVVVPWGRSCGGFPPL